LKRYVTSVRPDTSHAMLRLSALACLVLCGLAVASAADPYYVKFEVVSALPLALCGARLYPGGTG